MATTRTREAVGIFDNQAKLDSAVAELELSEFAHHDISVLGDQDTLEERFGSDTVKPERLEDNPEAPRGTYVHPEEKTIGASVVVGIPAYIAGCIAALMVNPATHFALLGAVTTGSLFGALLGGAVVYFMKQRMQSRATRQIKKGGLLLWVRTPNSTKEKRALDILRRHGGRHVHVHSIA